MPKSSSGDLYWIENQYIMINRYMYLEKVKKNHKYSTHNVSIQWALKKNILYVVKFDKIHELPGTPPSSPSTVGFALEQLRAL